MTYIIELNAYLLRKLVNEVWAQLACSLYILTITAQTLPTLIFTSVCWFNKTLELSDQNLILRLFILS